uniref:Putative cpij009905 px serine/threonine kinase n=1 Tax=Aedes albopictus TaxID=7160 RepID=A0A023EU04_AEDAL
MSLRAIQKRDRNKLSSSQQKQQHFINKSRSFGGGPTTIVVAGSGSSNISSVGASATASHHNNSHHHRHHHQLSSKNEKWRNSSTVSISSSATATLTPKKRSVSYPSLQKRSTTHSSSSSLRFTKSESDLYTNAQSPGGMASSDTVDTNNLYLGAKSEVCLRTLAVKSTHQPPAPFRQASLTTSGTGGGQRHRMYESSRRPSEISGGDLGRADKYAEISNNNNVAVRIPIIGYEVMEERARFTIFKLRIENSISHTCWLVLRRYTDFVRLNNKLRTLFPHCTLVLPRKKWFGDNFSSGFIDNRIQGLQTFINTIMGDEAMRTCPVVREFFCLDEPPSYSESMEESRIIFEAQEETISHLKQQLQTKDELISALQAKLANEMSRNKVLSNVLRNSFENCPKCAKQIGNHLKESAMK